MMRAGILPWDQRLWLAQRVIAGIIFAFAAAPPRSAPHDALIELSDPEQAVELAKIVNRWLYRKSRRGDNVQFGTVIMALGTVIANGAIGTTRIVRHRGLPTPPDLGEQLRDAAADYVAEIITCFPVKE